MFHAEILNDHKRLSNEAQGFTEIPKIKRLEAQEVSDNFYQVKMEIRNLIEQEVSKLKEQKSESS